MKGARGSSGFVQTRSRRGAVSATARDACDEALQTRAQQRAEVNESSPERPMKTAKIAVLGDLHGRWDDWDVDYFDRSDYELLLFTGDLGSGTGEAGVKIARSIARLAKPALVMPGNNDVEFQPAISAEFFHQRGLIDLLDTSTLERRRSVSHASGRVALCGYSLHPLTLSCGDLTVLAGRPHSMGGTTLSFPDDLQRNHDIQSLEESTSRLIELVNTAPTRDLIVLSHNGPYGLGGAPTDIWGCDFKEGGGDWGDPDLEAAIDHARGIGKRVRAVVAGHMHLATRGGEPRTERVNQEGTLHVNAARVPRIFAGPDGAVRSHVSLEISEQRLSAREIAVPSER